MITLLTTSLELGLIYALVALGTFLTFKVLNFPDLTVDGSFVVGAATTAILIRSGVPASASMLAGMTAGIFAGILTATIHAYFGIGKILAGVLSLGILYTVSLRIMRGPNISLLQAHTILAWLKVPLNDARVVGFLILIVGIAILLLVWFLKTETGLQLRATGDNESTARSLAIRVNTSKYTGIAIANGFAALAGGIIAQYQGFVDIGMGNGILILALAAVMLGDMLGKQRSTLLTLLFIVVGAIIYQLIINISLRLGLPSTDIKLATALIVIIAIFLRGKKQFAYDR